MANSDGDVISGDLLRGFLELVRERTSLDDHPLIGVLGELPDVGGLSRNGEAASPGQQAVRKLRALWRQRFMPPVLNLEYRKGWNFFLILEVTYFYPFAQSKPFPETLKHTAALLCHEQYLAHVIADGDADQARALVRDNPAFWAGFIPKAMTPAEQTIHSRRNAAVDKLAREVRRSMGAANPILRVPVVAPVELGAIEPVALVSGPDAASDGARVELAASSEPLSPNAARIRYAFGGTPSHTVVRRPIAVAPDSRAQAQAVLDRLVGVGAQITPGQLDELALWFWPLGFPQSLGVRRAVTDDVWWWDEVYYQRELVEAFRTTNDDAVMLQCAAALRRSSLAVAVKDVSPLWPFEDHRWVPALEAVAQAALRSDPGTSRHAAALAVLARADRVMVLQGMDKGFERLCDDLMVTLADRAPQGAVDIPQIGQRQNRPDHLPAGQFALHSVCWLTTTSSHQEASQTITLARGITSPFGH